MYQNALNYHAVFMLTGLTLNKKKKKKNKDLQAECLLVWTLIYKHLFNQRSQLYLLWVD